MSSELERQLVLAIGNAFRARGWNHGSNVAAKAARHLSLGGAIETFVPKGPDRDFLIANMIKLPDVHKAIGEASAVELKQRGGYLRAILFSDVVNSTPTAARMGDDKWRTVLGRHNAIVAAAVESAGGRIVQFTGDGVLAMFELPTAAIEAASGVERGVAAIGLEVRAGIHVTEIVEIDHANIGGIGVHLASRVTGLARAGEILVTESVRAAVGGSDWEFVDHGEHQLKGFDQPSRIFKVASRRVRTAARHPAKREGARGEG